MKRRFFAFLVLGLLAIALSLLAKSGAPSVALAQEPQDPSAAPAAKDFLDNIPLTVVLDVACDARTFRLGNGRLLPEAKRGDSFIVEGKIYPGGTIPPGGTLEAPGPFNPDTAPGSIGKWVCRGTLNYDLSEIFAGAVPHVFATQFFTLNDGRVLVSDGPEGGGVQLRSIIGGRGGYSGAAGEVTEDPFGVNSTGLFNIRFTFKIKKDSIK
ncbi:MAG: hypothetical protein ACREEM_05470 [Blastocatellia bacterium]